MGPEQRGQARGQMVDNITHDPAEPHPSMDTAHHDKQVRQKERRKLFASDM